MSFSSGPPAVPSSVDEGWDLVERARKGDRKAFSTLYERHVTSVFGYVLARTSDRMLAEELTSETFLRAFRGLGSLTYRGKPFRAWLTTIARNLILDEARSARRRYEVFLPADFDEASTGTDPAAEVCGRFVAAEIRRRMDVLTDDQRECLRLRFFEHLPVQEVARLMQRTEGSVRALQMRAVRRLGAALSADFVTT